MALYRGHNHKTRPIARLPIFALVLSLYLLAASGLPAFACTDFRLNATDGSIVVGRSMEWGLDLKSQLQKHSRGEQIQSHAPGGKMGLSWKSKYGFVGINSYGTELSLDGLNERGFSIELLWLPGSKYQTIAAGDESKAVSLLDFGTWLLGNFSSVEEAKAALKNIRVWAPSLPEWGGEPTAHIALHDADGKSAVIEFTDGSMNIFDNPNGILTNAPTFDWQITNLRNYIDLSPVSHSGKSFGELDLLPTGQGTGLCGMPGDLSPPSRFVHTTAYVHFSKRAVDAKSAVLLAQHILNSVDIPVGVIRTADSADAHCDYTQWIVIKDLKNRVLHFRAYSDFSLHTVQLAQMDFSEGSKAKSCPIAGDAFFCDVSNYLK
ncbi:MAG: choloylglycine hydrolase family protein [Candidatus Obscuribacterales bacterium]|nr:choloylglycine hydrolase family protein [Candidatus Obscuribacterales bacterium]